MSNKKTRIMFGCVLSPVIVCGVTILSLYLYILFMAYMPVGWVADEDLSDGYFIQFFAKGLVLNDETIQQLAVPELQNQIADWLETHDPVDCQPGSLFPLLDEYDDMEGHLHLKSAEPGYVRYEVLYDCNIAPADNSFMKRFTGRGDDYALLTTITVIETDEGWRVVDFTEPVESWEETGW